MIGAGLVVPIHSTVVCSAVRKLTRAVTTRLEVTLVTSELSSTNAKDELTLRYRDSPVFLVETRLAPERIFGFHPAECL